MTLLFILSLVCVGFLVTAPSALWLHDYRPQPCYTTHSSISLILFFKESKLHVIILHYYYLLLFPCLLCTCLKGTLHSNTVFWVSCFNNLKEFLGLLYLVLKLPFPLLIPSGIIRLITRSTVLFYLLTD